AAEPLTSSCAKRISSMRSSTRSSETPCTRTVCSPVSSSAGSEGRRVEAGITERGRPRARSVSRALVPSSTSETRRLAWRGRLPQSKPSVFSAASSPWQYQAVRSSPTAAAVPLME
ncbi:MAG: hypothetical protein DYH12_16795, partial [Sorangiineae bacterium PRO1]|nr:hypothetical protein [Sorangiineae bacterium PRO1]